MTAAVLAIYSPWIYLRPDQQLEGSDYILLHERRIDYARQALFNSPHALPGWYSREALGTPFWANLQNFPWIPTRLLLLPFDPGRAYVIGVNLAAVLAASFTFAFARKIGLGRIASMASGWTFAASGFFASRVLAGHLPLLEAYAALPLLLYLVEWCLQRSPPSIPALLILTLSTAAILLAGHPQLSLYALATASLYALLRAPGRRSAQLFIFMALGAGIAAFALLPFFELILRSTRTLNLNPADNDVVFPVSHLLAFILPWQGGALDLVHRGLEVRIAGSNEYVFWDTVCYVGRLPLLAVVILTLRWLFKKQLPDRRILYLAAIGLSALVLACAPPHIGSAATHLTLLRSPARLIYLTTFALSMVLGAALDALLKLAEARHSKILRMFIALILAAHVLDLGSHDQNFINAIPYKPPDPAALAQAKEIVGDQRVAIDWDLGLPINRRLDDIGFFDSLVLAKPYKFLLALAHLPPQANLEFFNGSILDDRSLAACGVKVVVSQQPDGNIQTRILDHPAPRAAFFSTPSNPSAELTYHRISSDNISVAMTTDAPGYLRILEAWDKGWNATIDGKPATPFPADDVFLSLPIPPGSHQVTFRYSTPGAPTGAAISIASLALLILMLASRRKMTNAIPHAAAPVRSIHRAANPQKPD
jgi:hypothetical protein